MPHKDPAAVEPPARQKHIYQRRDSWILMKIKAVERGLKTGSTATVLESFETYLHLLECISQFFWSFVFQYPRVISSWQIKEEKKRLKIYIYFYIGEYIYTCECVHVYACMKTAVKYNKSSTTWTSFAVEI